jgi:hypothetical protein
MARYAAELIFTTKVQRKRIGELENWNTQQSDVLTAVALRSIAALSSSTTAAITGDANAQRKSSLVT